MWRRYFVANEWNEIQTQRVTVPIFTIFTTIFFLEVVGFGNLATAQPGSTWNLGDDNLYYAPMNRMLRFALIGSVYLIIGTPCTASFIAFARVFWSAPR